MSTAKFSPLEDLLVFVLETLSPCDINFISDHMEDRQASTIEARLNQSDYWSNTRKFKKIPLMMFEIIFIMDGHWISRSLILLTSKRLIPLRCRGSVCIHEFSIPQVKLHHSPGSSHGVNTEELSTFIANNCKKEYIPMLKKSPAELHEFLVNAKIDFTVFNVHSNKTAEELRPAPSKLIVIDEQGDIHLEANHQQTLKNIIKAIGKTRWEDTVQLLLAQHDHIVDFDAEDIEIYRRFAQYYRKNLDQDMVSREFTRDEEKCVIMMYKCWSQTLPSEGLWHHLARHMLNRTGLQLKSRFLRETENHLDLTLSNIKKYAGDPSKPAVYYDTRGHVISLTIFMKSTAGMDVTTRLQREVRFLVAGTQEEMFLLPCKYTALRCSHLGLQQEKFTYDPTRPAEQFITFVRLTFANALKKAGLVDNKNFHFTDILYKGRDIHDIMLEVERERFIVPKEIFMKINRRQMALPMNIASNNSKSDGEKRKSETNPQCVRKVGRDSSARGRRGRGRPRKYL